MSELAELARGLGAGASLLLLLAIVGAIRGDWVPGYIYRAKVKELEAMQAIAFRATGVAEGLTEVAKTK